MDSAPVDEDDAEVEAVTTAEIHEDAPLAQD